VPESGETPAPLICVMGPTASGKTGLALRLVEAFPLDIISVDSALVYRGMDIGTAKPDAQTLARAPHRLVDICTPAEAYSAARFRADAQREITAIHAAGRVPLLVGGTMLYFRALLDGLSELPQADPAIRRGLEAEAAAMGWPAMHQRLAQLDPRAAARIDPNDPQRIQRALEVHAITGRRISDLQSRPRSGGGHYRVLKLVVSPGSRQVLHQRIARRFEEMLRQGFEAEVRTLRRRGDLHAGLPAMRAVGYRQAWAWLDGRFTETEWKKKALAATRQLAKRQLTWLRREKQALWYDLEQEEAWASIISTVRNFLSRGR
jgi:tRNA dimethylallyltransferase